MKKATSTIVICSTLLGCAADAAARQACYAQGELEKDAAVTERCTQRGYRWTNCPDRPAILAELAEQKRNCP